MRRHNPLDDIYLEDPEAAIRYLIFRAENRPGCWTNVRTIDRALTVSLKITPVVEGETEEEEVPEQIAALISHATRMPDQGERYTVERHLVRHGLIPGERRERPERRAHSYTLTRAVEVTIG